MTLTPFPIRDGVGGSIQITIGKQVHCYNILPIPSDFGTAFRLTKRELVHDGYGMWELHDMARYDVNLNGQQSTCECKGFLHHGHCKHISGLTVLRQRGVI